MKYHPALASQLKLYENPLTPLRELIVNSYDNEEATKVEILFNPKDKIPLILRDNGTGIGEYDLTTIGNPHKKTLLTSEGRKPIGHKGIGRLSVLALSKYVTVSSKKLKGTFEFTDETIESALNEISKEYYAHGTEWCFYKPLLQEKLNIERIREYIIENLYGILRKFVFRVFLNNNPILPELPCPPERTTVVNLGTKKYNDNIEFTYCMPTKEEQDHFLCGKLFFSLKGITVQEHDFRGTGRLTGFIDINSDDIPLTITRDKLVETARTKAIKRAVRIYIDQSIKLHKDKVHELITQDSLEKIIEILDSAVKDLNLGRLYGEKTISGTQGETKQLSEYETKKTKGEKKKSKKKKHDKSIISSQLGFEIRIEDKGPHVPALIYAEHSKPVLVINRDNIILKDLKERTDVKTVNAQLSVLIPRKLLDIYIEQGKIKPYQKEKYLEKLIRELQDKFIATSTEDWLTVFDERPKLRGKPMLKEKDAKSIDKMKELRMKEIEAMRDE